MTKPVKVKNMVIGGGAKISVQSMTNTRTSDILATNAQIRRLEKAGCDIVRVAVLDNADALAIKNIKREIPLVADIHYDYKLAVAAIENGADKIRINPGNIGAPQKFAAVCDALKSHDIPLRIGANEGSIESGYIKKYGRTGAALAESALSHVSQAEKNGLDKIVISVKSSDVKTTVEAYEYIAKRSDYPLHLGVTEAGTINMGTIKNSIALGALLLQGIGDTLRVSLTADPVHEIAAAKSILRAVGLDKDYAELISCPTCGRCEWDMSKVAHKAEKLIRNIKKPLKIAIMGCAVNGIGEAKNADIGLTVSGGEGILFKKGKIVQRGTIEDIVKVFFEEVKSEK